MLFQVVDENDVETPWRQKKNDNKTIIWKRFVKVRKKVETLTVNKKYANVV